MIYDDIRLEIYSARRYGGRAQQLENKIEQPQPQPQPQHPHNPNRINFYRSASALWNHRMNKTLYVLLQIATATTITLVIIQPSSHAEFARCSEKASTNVWNRLPKTRHNYSARPTVSQASDVTRSHGYDSG